MAKPSWRAGDNVPNREDDIKVSFLGFTLEASGRMVVLVIMVLAVLAGGIVHDLRTVTLAEQFAVMTCVVTLTEPQKAEFRTEGKYCGDDSVYYRIRRQVRPEGQ